MKKIRMMIQLMMISGVCQSQVELKTSAVSYLASALHLNTEVGVSDDYGIEAEYLQHSNLDYINLAVKHYFKPDRGCDGNYAGVFVSTGFEDPGYGLEFGKKLISRRNLLFESGLGIGRAFENPSLIFSYKLHLGFRLNYKNNR